MKKLQTKSIELELINRTSSAMKKRVGRGPSDIKIHTSGNVLAIIIYGVLSNLEKYLLQSPEGKKVILEGRKLYLDMENEQRLADYERILGAKIVEHFDSYNPENDSAASLVVFDQALPRIETKLRKIDILD